MGRIFRRETSQTFPDQHDRNIQDTMLIALSIGVGLVALAIGKPDSNLHPPSLPTREISTLFDR